jgi:uncharacterized OB-fold protein
MTMARLPAPQPDNVNAAWWDATSRGVLLIQHCVKCGRYQHYPRPFCVICGASDLEWIESSGQGTVHSWTVIERTAYEDIKVPYVLALVDLAEGVRLLTHLVECEIGEVACGVSVALRWTKAPGDNTYRLPVFTIVAD